MITKLIFAGFGGQGIILAGKVLAYSAMLEGKEVLHLPAYGPEMRGGTCNCSVIISDSLITSPVVTNPDIALVFNKPSKEKFEEKVVENGHLFINKSLIEDRAERTDIENHYIEATNIANSMNSIKSANMVMLGALAKKTNIVNIETMIKSLDHVISKRNRSLIEINTKAMLKGYELD